MSQALVDDLKAKYPFFELENKHGIAKSLFLADGEEIVVPPWGPVKVASAALSSFPDIATFNYKNPTISVLDEYGVLNRKSPKENAKATAEAPAKNVESKSTETPSPIKEKNEPVVDARAAGNQTVTSSTSPSINTNANLETKGGPVTKPSGQK